MKIGILETGEVPETLAARHGDYPSMFEAMLGGVDPALEFLTVRVVSGEMPEDLRQADAWLVTGSRHGVYDDIPWIAPLRTFLHDCVVQGVPVIGICFGHQILAEALGGKVVKSDRGWGLGVQDYEVVARPGWMADLPDRFGLRAVHQDQVERLPEGATVLARSAHCPYAMLVYGDPERPVAFSVQPHPEYDAAFVEDLIEVRKGTSFSAEVAARALATMGNPVHGTTFARMIVDFLRLATAERAAA